MSESSTTVLESQCDWLTLSVHTKMPRDWLAFRAKMWMTNEVVLGNRIRPFMLNGYLGSQAGRVRWGEREAAGLLQLSGQLATDHFHTVYPIRDTLTRIDLAVTVRTPVLDDEHATNAYIEATAWRDAHPQAALPSLVRDANKGSTCYIGHRSSDFYLRVYNKQRECEARADPDGARYYANCWRYELECKGVAAEAVARMYASRADWPQFARGYVHAFAVKHGINPLFTPDGPPEKLLGFRRRSDRETRLGWLDKSVRPAVKWLLDNGDRSEVLQALGLGDPPGAEQVE